MKLLEIKFVIKCCFRNKFILYYFCSYFVISVKVKKKKKNSTEF